MELNELGQAVIRDTISDSQDIEKIIEKMTAPMGIPPMQVKAMLKMQPAILKSMDSMKEEAILETIDLVNMLLKDLDLYVD